MMHQYIPLAIAALAVCVTCCIITGHVGKVVRLRARSGTGAVLQTEPSVRKRLNVSDGDTVIDNTGARGTVIHADTDGDGECCIVEVADRVSRTTGLPWRVAVNVETGLEEYPRSWFSWDRPMDLDALLKIASRDGIEFMTYAALVAIRDGHPEPGDLADSALYAMYNRESKER